MKVKELIELLKQQDPEKEVFIQQGEEYDYMTVCTVKGKEIRNADEDDEDNEDFIIDAIVIEYQ